MLLLPLPLPMLPLPLSIILNINISGACETSTLFFPLTFGLFVLSNPWHNNSKKVCEIPHTKISTAHMTRSDHPCKPHLVIYLELDDSGDIHNYRINYALQHGYPSIPSKSTQYQIPALFNIASPRTPPPPPRLSS